MTSIKRSLYLQFTYENIRIVLDFFKIFKNVTRKCRANFSLDIKLIIFTTYFVFLIQHSYVLFCLEDFTNKLKCNSAL